MNTLPTAPTPAGFLDFIRTYMGIDAAKLPNNSPFIPFAYEIALLTTNLYFAAVVPAIYTMMVYNLAADILVDTAQDQPGSPTYGEPALPYFANLRRSFNSNGFVAGVVSSTSDNGTSTSLVVAESLSGLTLSDLQNLKTPWGRQYLAWAQKWGTGLWGLT